ncbi:MAG: FAD-dependent oxidoreductase [Geminicoccaceae bacterium]
MEELPKSVRYLVIGAGIYGLSTAWHLAEELERSGRGKGSGVLLIDKTGPGAGLPGSPAAVAASP